MQEEGPGYLAVPRDGVGEECIRMDVGCAGKRELRDWVWAMWERNEMVVNGGVVEALTRYRGCMGKTSARIRRRGLILCWWCHLTKGPRAYH